MSKWSRGLGYGTAFAIWCVAASFAAVAGWLVGEDRGPIPPGCGCFNPAAIPFLLGWGVLGAALGVLVVSAIMTAIAFVLYVRTSRGEVDATGGTSPSAVTLDQWLSEAGTDRAPNG